MNQKDKAITPEEYHEWLDLNEATAFLGIAHAQYTRRLLHETVRAVAAGEEPKFPWPEDGSDIAVRLKLKGYEKWFLNPASLAGYAPSTGIGAGDYSRWVFRLRHDSDKTIEDVRQAITDCVGAVAEGAEPHFTLEKGSQGKSRKGKSKSKTTSEDYTATIIASLSKPHPRATVLDS